MTPAARVAAAIDILDRIIAGEAAEKALTGWARGHRFAGSGDRAAIRDHVFDVLRRKRSLSWIGGGRTGRHLMLGWAQATGAELGDIFSGSGYGPAQISKEEQVGFQDLADAPIAVQLDCPDWLFPQLETDLGDLCHDTLRTFQSRAEVYLRVNRAKADRSMAQSVLLETGIETEPHPLSETALRITRNPRRLRQSGAYLNGIVELQDVSSQAAIDTLPLAETRQVLDVCAGGGGKSLAIAARGDVMCSAFDIDPNRMADLPRRAQRAGAKIEILDPQDLTKRRFDMVLCDVPCSGSGTWRRTPQSKWDLSPSRLDELAKKQFNIADQSIENIKINGYMAYLTCSVLVQENEAQVQTLLDQNSNLNLVFEKRISPLAGGDGFYVALLRRVT